MAPAARVGRLVAGLGERLERQKEMAKKRSTLVEEKLAKMRNDAERR
jgi:hypothetical protein